MKEYKRRFIETAAPLEGISEEVLLGQFINELKDDIKVEVRMLHLVSLEQAMELSVRVEEKNLVTNSRRVGASSFRSGSYSVYSKGSSTIPPYSLGPFSPPVSRQWGPGSPESHSKAQSPKSTVSTTGSTGEVKRLTEKELQEKRAKGLCYRCDAKWAMGHRCKKKELSVMLIEEEEAPLLLQLKKLSPRYL